MYLHTASLGGANRSKDEAALQLLMLSYVEVQMDPTELFLIGFRSQGIWALKSYLEITVGQNV